MIFRTLLAAALAFVFAVPVSGSSIFWLPRRVASVRAFVYDYTQEPDNSALFRKGHFHQGIINTGGALLSDQQIDRLRAAMKSNQPRIPGAFCYEPHHGFVFYDEKGKAMGHIELCFSCGNVSSSPDGLPKVEWDWKAIKALLDELKIPFCEDNAAYTKLYQEAQAAGKK